MYYELQPLRIQAGWKIEYNNFTEYDFDIHGLHDLFELNEDLLRIYNEKANLTIDLGWYPSHDINGNYLLLLVKDYKWDINRSFSFYVLGMLSQKGSCNMRNFDIEKEMYRRAVALIKKRYPTGWGGAGVVHTAKGHYFTSVSIDTANASAVLCIETGAILEAHKYNEKVTHCMCLVRENENAPYKVLSPCGICQERLRFWGEDVQVAVTTEDNSLKFITLAEMQPYHWTKAYPAYELEHFEE